MLENVPRVFFVMLLLASCNKINTKSSLRVDETSAIKLSMDLYRKAWLQEDSTKIVNYLTDKVVFFRPELHTKPIFGKKAVSDFWFQNNNSPYKILSFNVTNEDIYFDNNLAVYQGVSRYFWCKEENGVRKDTIFTVYDFTNILIKEDDEWKLDRITHIQKNKDYYR